MTCPDRQSGHSRGPSGEGPEFWRGRGPRVKKEELTGPRPRSRCLGLPDPGTVVTGAPRPALDGVRATARTHCPAWQRGPGHIPGPPSTLTRGDPCPAPVPGFRARGTQAPTVLAGQGPRVLLIISRPAAIHVIGVGGRSAAPSLYAGGAGAPSPLVI